MECSNSQLKRGKIFEIQHSLQVSFIARWLKPSTWNMKTNVSCRLRECPIIRLLLEVWGDLEAEKGTKNLCNNHNIILLYQVWKGGSEEKKEENTNGGNDDRTIQGKKGHFELHTKENRLVLEKYFSSKFKWLFVSCSHIPKCMFVFWFLRFRGQVAWDLSEKVFCQYRKSISAPACSCYVNVILEM